MIIDEYKTDMTPYCIAEAGINHNGDLETALKMIEVAKHAGANAVKFQTYKTEEFCNKDSELYSIFKQCEFTVSEWKKIKEKCDKEKITFISTPQNHSDLELLLELGIPAIKVGSDDFTNLPLLKRYSKTGMPLIMSCGMSDMAEVHNALDTVGYYEGYQVVLMLCTSQYPTPPEDVNLLKLLTLRYTFSNLCLGFSDHTQGTLAAPLAISYGAVAFETHFTLDKNMIGPDHYFSKNPKELSEWITNIHLANTMRGSDVVKPTLSEMEMRKIARRSVTAITDIQEGEILTENNIGLHRPGTGLPPSMMASIIGLHATKNISKDTLLAWGDFR